ncbi:MAG: aminotransferase class I/II-fold pyridoxal phosphate-dependent enzyme, partial [Microcoleaceae cyanobacterium]
MVSYLNHLFAERIGGRDFGQSDRLYKFEKIKIAKRKAQQENPHINLIDLGVGEPDWMAEKEVVEILYQEALKWENRGYTEYGIQDFKVAASEYLDRVFGVENINPETEIIHGIGSKSILALLPQAFINPGDAT